jgi:HTH-type transcriptional regulator / antitoxin HigA
MNSRTFQPDWLSAPGGTILDLIEERGMSSNDLAGLLGYSVERTEKLISGRESITRDVAALLANRVGGSEKFWLSREVNYRNEVAHLQSSGSLPAAKAWLDELPLKDMQKFGWLPSHRPRNASFDLICTSKCNEPLRMKNCNVQVHGMSL